MCTICGISDLTQLWPAHPLSTQSQHIPRAQSYTPRNMSVDRKIWQRLVVLLCYSSGRVFCEFELFVAVVTAKNCQKLY